MKTVLKWLAILLGTLVVVAAAGYGGVHVAAERVLQKTYDVPLTPIDLPTDSASLAEGKRLATVRGCYGGCHGSKGLEGGVFFDEPGVARLVAPNLTKVVRQYSDAELERAIRHGVQRDGRSVFAMPADMFYHLSDKDLGAIIAFLRSQPEVDGPVDEPVVGPLGRVGIVTGQYKPIVADIDDSKPRVPAADATDPIAHGRYVAMTACSECHEQDLRGGDLAPNLHALAPAYSSADFTRLMRTGVATAGRQLGLMAQVARSRFAYLTDSEISSLHAFLKSEGPVTPVAGP